LICGNCVNPRKPLAAIARGLGGAREFSDGVDRTLFAGKEIEPGAIVPGVAREDFQRLQVNAIFEIPARGRE
jgi:hypothetical protein